MIAKSILIKVRGGRYNGCAVKAAGLTSGGLRCVPKRGTERFARVVTAVQKSAESIVVGNSDEGPERRKGIRVASLCRQSGRITSWSWPLVRGARVKPEEELAKGQKSKWRKPILTT